MNYNDIFELCVCVNFNLFQHSNIIFRYFNISRNISKFQNNEKYDS